MSALLLHEESHLELRESFKEQLVREFCVENYLFYFATLNFEANREHSDASKATTALNIYQEFLIENARNEINISGRLRESIDDHLHKSIPNFDRFTNAFFNRKRSLQSFRLGRKRDYVVELIAQTHANGVKEDLPRISDGDKDSQQDASEGACQANSLDVHVFEAARREIFQLMQRDSYVSWKKKYRRDRGL